MSAVFRTRVRQPYKTLTSSAISIGSGPWRTKECMTCRAASCSWQCPTDRTGPSWSIWAKTTCPGPSTRTRPDTNSCGPATSASLPGMAPAVVPEAGRCPVRPPPPSRCPKRLLRRQNQCPTAEYTAMYYRVLVKTTTILLRHRRTANKLPKYKFNEFHILV